MNRKKYWYSSQGNGLLPIPIAPQGWYNIIIAAVVALVAAIIFLPLHDDPTQTQINKFLIIAIPDAVIFTFLVFNKKEPRQH